MNTKSYNQAVKDYSDRLYRFVLKNLHKEVETAKDIVQNCYEALWKNRENVTAEKAKSYLFAVAHNQVVDVYRKSGRMLYVAEYKENDLAVDADTNDKKELMHRLLQALPTMQRSMVLLKDYEGYGYEQIAVMLDVTEGQVKINLFRARKKMKDLMELKVKKLHYENE